MSGTRAIAQVQGRRGEIHWEFIHTSKCFQVSFYDPDSPMARAFRMFVQASRGVDVLDIDTASKICVALGCSSNAVVDAVRAITEFCYVTSKPHGFAQWKCLADHLTVQSTPHGFVDWNYRA